jgi:hypothetical protein
MQIDTMLRRLASASLQRRRANEVQRKQRSMLTIGLGMAVMIFVLLGTVACGGSDGSLAQSGLNLLVVSGQGRIVRSGGGNDSVVEGQEAIVTTDDQITADEAGVKLLLANGSMLYLNPGTDLQVITFTAEGTVRLSQLKGQLEIEAASPLLTVEISTSVTDAFALKTMQFTAIPTISDTAFELWLDDVDAHLTVEDGEVQVTNDDRTETIPAGGKVTASPGGELVVFQTPTVEPTVTAVVSAITPSATGPSPTAIATPIPTLKYPAPGLIGPDDGSEFKGDDTVLLMWDTPTPLSEDEWYEVQLWREGEVPYTVVQRTREGTWKVEPRYYPGRYQWRILIVRSQESQKESLSPPSDTRRFNWLSPVKTPTAPTTIPPVSGTSVDLTVYLRGTKQGVATFSGERVNAGQIYSEGETVYGDVAVQIGSTKYHFDQDPEPVGVEQLPAPYRVEFKFSDSLVAVAEGMQPGSNPEKAQFWVGTLNCNSATSADKPYKIEMTLYAGGEAKKHTEISFLVADDPLCGGGGSEPGGDGKPTPKPRG